MARRLQDRAVADPHRLVVDLVLRAEEEEIAGLEPLEGDGHELRILERLLVAVAAKRHAVLEKDARDEPGAVEAERRRPAPGVRRAEEALAECDPVGGGTKGRRKIFFEGQEGDVPARDPPFAPIRQAHSHPRVGSLSLFTF